ncbi:band 3 anion transport protein-like [Diadema antillarum]|uniref:band 3 anion transport protein-like n=1 Tax=Diadema antillarum TaxID=105358 RepID=UPI003A84D4AF
MDPRSSNRRRYSSYEARSYHGNEDNESQIPLFADHDSISQLLGGVEDVGGGGGGEGGGRRGEQPKTRTRFMSLDITGTSNPFLRRSLSNPRRLNQQRPLGISPLATTSHPSNQPIPLEQVWVIDENRTKVKEEKREVEEQKKEMEGEDQTGSGPETSPDSAERPTHQTMAQHLLNRSSSCRLPAGERGQTGTSPLAGKPRSFASHEDLATAEKRSVLGAVENGNRSSSLTDVRVRRQPGLAIPVIGIEEPSDQDDDDDEDEGSSVAKDNQDGTPLQRENKLSQSPTPSPPSFLNPDLVQRLSSHNPDGSMGSLSTRTGSDSDVTLSGSNTPDMNEHRRSVGVGDKRVRKSSLRKKTRAHDPNRRVQLALDSVKEESAATTTPPSMRRYKKREDGRPQVQLKIGGDDESETDAVDGGEKNDTDDNYEDDSRGRDRRRFTPQERFPISTKRAHEPHELFVQLDAWQYDHNSSEEGFQEKIWKERARWIKFEEDWEDGSERWGKPHVASLTFNSLPQLRKGLENGLMLLDCQKTTLPGIFDAIIDGLEREHDMSHNDRLVISKMLRASLGSHHYEEPSNIVRASIRRLSTIADFGHHHRTSHQNQHNSVGMQVSRSMSAMEGTTFPNGNGHADLESKMSMLEADKLDKTDGGITVEEPVSQPSLKQRKKTVDGIAVPGINRSPSSATITSHQQPRSTDGIMRKIPPDAEGALVMVAKEENLDAPYMALVRLDEAIHFENFLEVPLPLRYIFLVTGPPLPTLEYHEVARALATLFSDEVFRNIAYSALERHDILVGINEFLNDTMVLPPGEWDRDLLLPITRLQRKEQEKVMRRRKTLKLVEADTIALKQMLKEEQIHGDALRRTGYLFGGLYKDIRRRYPHYLSDIYDSFNITSLAAFVFLYFACLSPAITFGGLLGQMTEGLMGVSEMIVSTSLNGIIFSLLSGQPLIIIGPTGPVLVFEEHLLKFCKGMEIELLPFRAWIGIWTAIIATICVAVEGSVLVRHFTRFTEEIFALLISIIFIYETATGLKYVACQNPFQENYCPANLNDSYVSTPLNMYYNSTNPANIYVSPTETMLTPEVDLGISFSSQSPATITSPSPTPFGSDLTTFFNVMNNVTNGTGYYGEDKYDKGGKKKKCYVPYGWNPRPNTTLMSIILTFGTFFIAFFIRQFRNSRFLGRTSRRAFGDIGIAIAITVMVTVSYVTKNVYLQKLSIGDGFVPTDPSQRGWFINPMGLSKSMPLIAIMGACVPAFLVFILLYMETLLTGVIVGKRENKLKKGTGFHLDLFIMGVLTMMAGLLGLPWMCAATVRTVSHVASLSVMTRTDAPGVKPRLDHIKDQRMTNFFVSLAIGLSLYMAPLLREVPIAVLLGVFLYLGLCSLSGLQMIERIKVFFMPSKHHPDRRYIRMVKAWKIHLFTFIQLVCLTVVWFVKSSIIAICFPFFFILLVAIRRLMRFIYTEEELDALDCEEEEEESVDGGRGDEYQATHMPV